MQNDQPSPARKQTLPKVPLPELLNLLGDSVDAGQIETYYDSEGNAVASWQAEPEQE